MKPADYLFVYCAAPDQKAAEKLARRALSLRLAACANIFPEIKSLYWWQRAIQKESETILLLKTTASLYKKLESELKKIHPYKCPCIIALPLSKGSPDFLKWISDQTAGGPAA